jgi:hypothetical protein
VNAKELAGFDVVVVGGGPGGFAAAVAAGRSGAKTLLLEREGCLGGGATTMLVHPFMPHVAAPVEPNGPRAVVNAGIFAELCRRLIDMGAGTDDHARRFEDEAAKLVMDQMCAEAGVKVVFHAALFDAQSAGGVVKSVRLAHNSGPLAASGKVFIDGTGDALLAALAAADCQIGDADGTMMPMTLNFVVGDVDYARMPSHQDFKKLCAAGAADNPPLVNLNFSCLSRLEQGRRVHFNAIRIPGNTLDACDVSRAEAEGRRRVANFVQWLRARVPGFEKCWLVKTGQHIGIRENRRVTGDFMLTSDAWFEAKQFDDGIACCAYAIDVHSSVPNQTNLQHMKGGTWYQIPYRCLTPKGLTNLLMASRSISADRLMHSSLRIMPPVMNIGEAAGYAAAMSLPSGNVRGIDVQALRERIRQAGGVIEPKLP